MTNKSSESIGVKLASWAIRRPVTTVMVFISLLLLGAISSRLLPLEKFPGIDIPALFIQVPYPNATPTEVERLITRPLEEAIATISGIKRLRSKSTDNGAQIEVEFAWDENINAKSIEIRENVDAIRNTLPSDVERVLIYQFNTSDMPIFQLRISSEQDLSLAYDLLERQLKRPIERVPGVSKVEMYGVDKRQIVINLDAKKIESLKIDVAQLTSKLNQYNFSMAAGHIYDNNSKVLINPMGEFRSIDEINELIVAPNVRLKDIASIKYELPKLNDGRHLDQTYAIGMNILKESNANLVDVADRVLEVIEATGNNPQFNGINLYVMENTAEGVTGSLNDLLSAGLIGALLSIVVLYAFLRQVTVTLIVVLSVPISICITLGFMYIFGYSLNVLSLMGLLLAVGMLVDNSVVITESIVQERAKETDTLIATKKGVSKVAMAVIAGTATTMIVFLPNIVGKKIDVTIFLEHVAIAICISLFASLIISQTLIPLLLSKFKPSTKATSTNAVSKPNKLHSSYMKSLRWSQEHKKTSGFIAILLLVSIAIPMQFVQGDEESNFADNRIFMRYHPDQSYTVDEAEDIVNKMENYLYDNQERFYIKSVYSYYSSDNISSTILLNDGDLPLSNKQIMELIRADMPKFTRAAPKFGFDSGNGGGLEIKLYGQSTQMLLEIANNLIPVLARIEGLEDVHSEAEGQFKELQVQVDRTKIYRLGLTAQDVSNLVSIALRGQNLRTFRHGDSGEIMVRLQLEESLHKSIDALKKLPIIQQNGLNITLENVATVAKVSRLKNVDRYDRQTGLNIYANINDITLDEARKKIKTALEPIELPAGYSYSLTGSFQRQDEAQQVMMVNMLLAVCMIYIVMAALFESLLLPTAVITSLLYSYVGVFWAFMFTGTSMSVMGMIGMLILMGIVVNNGIVLVDRINQLINQGQSINEAVIEACDTRLRPILMTVATTVLGLVPLALGNTTIGGDGPPYSPMAIAIIGGLCFSTITSLYLIPLIYTQLIALRNYFANIIVRGKSISQRYIKL